MSRMLSGFIFLIQLYLGIVIYLSNICRVIVVLLLRKIL